MKKMFRLSLFTFILSLSLVIRGYGFKFSISRDLDDKLLDEELRTTIEIFQDCEEDVLSNVTFKVDTPSVLASGDQNFTIFFANDMKNVLEVYLKKYSTEGMFYKTPYELEKRMKGQETTRTNNNGRIEISGFFPKSWLPYNCTLVSGSLNVGEGKYYNYYGLRNFKLSIPDLKVLEEYKTYTCRNE